MGECVRVEGGEWESVYDGGRGMGECVGWREGDGRVCSVDGEGLESV